LTSQPCRSANETADWTSAIGSVRGVTPAPLFRATDANVPHDLSVWVKKSADRVIRTTPLRT